MSFINLVLFFSSFFQNSLWEAIDSGFGGRDLWVQISASIVSTVRG